MLIFKVLASMRNWTSSIICMYCLLRTVKGAKSCLQQGHDNLLPFCVCTCSGLCFIQLLIQMFYLCTGQFSLSDMWPQMVELQIISLNKLVLQDVELERILVRLKDWWSSETIAWLFFFVCLCSWSIKSFLHIPSSSSSCWVKCWAHLAWLILYAEIDDSG